MKQSDKDLKESILKLQLLHEQKFALEEELEKVNQELNRLLNKQKLIAYDPIKNIYLLNVNYRA